MNRFSIKIAGQSGQGINVMGEILTKAFKRSGLYTFGYREYPSLIKGGHATYQIEVDSVPVYSPSRYINLIFVMNMQATLWHESEFKKGEASLIFHDNDNPRINDEELKILKNKGVDFVYVPALRMSKEVGGNYVTSNLVTIGTIWRCLGLDLKILLDVIELKFASKPEFIEIDKACATKGYDYNSFEMPKFSKRVLKPKEVSNEEKLKLHILQLTNKNILRAKKIFEELPRHKRITSDDLIMTGNEASALAAISGGVRAYYAYPMTPTSAILQHLADVENETGMVVKQAEDEITTAAMAIGSMHMGTRALVGTSGGGFDLMTEHLSLSGMLEAPFVCILGQRPGPATGMPTWTSQGDLLLAVNAGHGEFPRCVLAVKDAEDNYYKIQEALNIADEYQMPVIVLTDKYAAESLFQIDKLDINKIEISRGKLITSKAKLAELKADDRYKFTEDGVSPRWIPGSKAVDFVGQSDEHDERGNVTEDGEVAAKMIEKRIRKMHSLEKLLPEPKIYSNKSNLSFTLGGKPKETGNQKPKTINLLGWGSTYCTVHDVMNYYKEEGIEVNYLHFEYLWPLKTNKLNKFLNNNPNTILIENNIQGQLGKIIKMETGLEIKHKILKWDGRPFYVEELKEKIDRIINN